MEVLPKNILIACGGTGGHLAPGIALAQVLIKRGHHCELLISSRQIDQVLTSKYPTLVFRALPARSGLGRTHSRLSPAGLWNFFLEQLASLRFCARLMRRFRPDVVVGFGGFSTFAAGLCAACSGLPLFLHEANYRVGKTVRILKGLASRVYLPEDILQHKVPPQKVGYLGMPLREDLIKVSREEARKALGMPLQGCLLVVMGGSQGSAPLNQWAAQNAEALMAAGINLYCLTGSGKMEPRTLERLDAKAVFAPFSLQMHLLYAAADLVLARAGAGTLAELIHFATPSILVPYPYAADDHQRANAASLVRRGGALSIDEKDSRTLHEETFRLLRDDEALAQMRRKLSEIDAGHPALTIAEELEALPQKGRRLEACIQAELKKAGIVAEQIHLSFNEPLAPKTTFGIGGPARVFAQPRNEKDLTALLKIASRFALPVFCLGRGSNLLVLDRGFEGLVVQLNHPDFQRIELLPRNRLRAAAGSRLKNICAEACKAGLQGFEFLEGIPATLGGALRMNAGACGCSIFDRIREVALVDSGGNLKKLSGSDFHPSYRCTPELEGAVVLWATLEATGRATPEEIRALTETLAAKRKATQPREASAGCVFKNPTPELGAGRLIDQELKMKGHRIGGAAVSEVHANFIVNRGNATATDVISLINEIRRKAWIQREIQLEPEIMLLGGRWKDYLLPISNS